MSLRHFAKKPINFFMSSVPNAHNAWRKLPHSMSKLDQTANPYAFNEIPLGKALTSSTLWQKTIRH